MVQDDFIEVMTEQIGGNGKHNTTSTKLNKYVAKHGPEFGEDEMSFVVNAVEIGGKLISEMEFVIGRETKIKEFMDAWAKRAGCAVDEVVFRYNSDKEGPGLPFSTEDDAFGDVSRHFKHAPTACMILMFCQDDWIPGDEIFVSALTDEPINFARPREDVAIEEISTGPKVSNDTILITVEFPDEEGGQSKMHCKMTKTMSFDKFISMFSKRWDIDASARHLTFNGKTVFPSDTPASVSHWVSIHLGTSAHNFSDWRR